MKLIAFLFLLSGIACQKKNMPVSENSSDKRTFLALGDSYTIGESVSTEERWPVQFTSALNERGINFNTPKIIARTGWTTDELQAGISKETLNTPYDLVSLLIGVNNQYRGRSVENFIPDFEKLLAQAVQYAGNDKSKVIVVSIPDYGVTPFARGSNIQKIAKELDAYNSVQKSICEREGILFYDITPISRLAKNDASLIASDGLHPSGKMYRLWVNLILENLPPHLKK